MAASVPIALVFLTWLTVASTHHLHRMVVRRRCLAAHPGAEPVPGATSAPRIAPAATRRPARGGTNPARRVRRLWQPRVLAGTALTLALVPLVGPVAGAGVGVLAGIAGPKLSAVRARRRAAEQVAADQPDVIDLVVALVRAGLSPSQAAAWMAERGPPSWQSGFAAVDAARQRGERFADALTTLTERVGTPATPLVDALVSADRYGHPLAPTLERLSDEARTARRQLAEAAARRLPVKLSFPLVCCTLPAFVLLTIAPLLGGALSALRSGGSP